MSQIGWIDFSPDDRSRAKNVLAMLAEPGTLDELGIGQVRDGFSNLLFPGFSTIQTRAKYFITLPRILRDYQNLTPSRKKKGIEQYLKNQEDKVARIFVDHDESEPGIIGRTRIKTSGVDRRPSVIYWNGLRTFGLIKTSGSLADFCRKLDQQSSLSVMELADLTEGIDDKDASQKKNLIKLPMLDSEWMDEKKLRIKLTAVEAEFLKGKMMETNGIESTVPAQLFKHNLAESALENNTGPGKKAFDLLAEFLVRHSGVDPQCKNNIKLARQFSLAMEGPHIRYNYLLAKINKVHSLAKTYQGYYSNWLTQIKKDKTFTLGCDEDWFLAAENNGKVRIKTETRTFIRGCCETIQSGGNKKTLDKLVEEQAMENKGDRSLLKQNLKKQLEKGQWMGIRRLDYRWGTAKKILQDIQEGLNADTSN